MLVVIIYVIIWRPSIYIPEDQSFGSTIGLSSWKRNRMLKNNYLEEDTLGWISPLWQSGGCCHSFAMPTENSFIKIHRTWHILSTVVGIEERVWHISKGYKSRSLHCDIWIKSQRVPIDLPDRDHLCNNQ